MSSIAESISKAAKNFRDTNNLSLKDTIAVLSARFPEVKDSIIIAIAIEVFEPADIVISDDEAEEAKAAPKVTRVRRLPLDEHRCCARTFYPKKHLEDGRIKHMRDEHSNAFGDRCRNKISDGYMFCSQHIVKQTYGIWNGYYAGDLHTEQVRSGRELGFYNW